MSAQLPSFQDLELVDLTVVLAEDFPCWWPAHMPYQQKTFNYFADQLQAVQPIRSRAGAYHTRWLLIDEHTGTHFDAPTHFIPPPSSELPNAGPAGEISVDRVPLRQLMGPAAVVDVSGLAHAEPGESPYIEPDAIRSWEAEHGELRPDEVVLLWSGWDRRYRRMPEGSAYSEDVTVRRSSAGWPAPSVAAMRLLLERGVRCVGTDAPTMGAAHDGVPVHVAGLSAGAVFIEGLAHLEELPARGAWFCFAPLKVEGGTGAPGRAFALVPKGSP